VEKHPGSYLGTELNERWWRRYLENGFFARGAGEYWFDQDALCFQRFLTSSPLRIPYSCIRGTEVGTWHAGTWRLGVPIVKVAWEQHGQHLSSGIAVSRDLNSTQAFIEELAARVRAASSNP
jgi:hypothetical protein